MNDLRPGGTDPRWRLTPTKYVVAGLLLIGIVVPLLVSTYDQVEPRLLGFPFFYWYQLLWVFLAAGLCGLSFWLLKRERDAYARRQDTSAGRAAGGTR
jgi:high-affinity Fe2+/Pb2+ permease